MSGRQFEQIEAGSGTILATVLAVEYNTLSFSTSLGCSRGLSAVTHRDSKPYRANLAVARLLLIAFGQNLTYRPVRPRIAVLTRQSHDRP